MKKLKLELSLLHAELNTFINKNMMTLSEIQMRELSQLVAPINRMQEQIKKIEEKK